MRKKLWKYVPNATTTIWWCLKVNVEEHQIRNAQRLCIDITKDLK